MKNDDVNSKNMPSIELEELAGSGLFSGEESYLKDVPQKDISLISGGGFSPGYFGGFKKKFFGFGYGKKGS
jgi:hypothetical protein